MLLHNHCNEDTEYSMQAHVHPNASSSILQAQIETQSGSLGMPLSDVSAQPVTWPLGKNQAGSINIVVAQAVC